MTDDGVEAVTMRLRLDIAYDGTDFHGWAVQPGRRTVAGEIERALAVLLRTDVRTVVAGRTDAGVHATGQVAHIDVDRTALERLAPRHLRAAAVDATDAGLVGLRRRLAGLLPPDVRAWQTTAAPDGFDARFSALRRHYRYRIAVGDWGVPPLRRTDTAPARHRLDIDAMRRAATELVGLHDFAAFCRTRPGATTIRDLQRVDVRTTTEPMSVSPVPACRVADDSASATIVEVDVTADAFCQSMVRSLVGALVAVGEGRFDTDRPAALLASGSRAGSAPVMPARGLTLVGVDYPDASHLAERARLTRAVRRAAELGGAPGRTRA